MKSYVTKKLYVNGKKSEFFLQEIRYLGHIISKEGIKMDLEKLQVIAEWPQPKNLHELRSFIGMCAYYRKFIEKFSVTIWTTPWFTKEERAFQALKAKCQDKGPRAKS